MVARVAAAWSRIAIGLVIAHAVLHGVLQARPGRIAMVLFAIAPSLLLVMTMVTAALMLRDLLYGGWRRLLRGASIFPLAALAASFLLSLVTYRVYPSSHDGREPAWCLAVPLAGDVAVLQGGAALDANYHAGAPSQRYAYDLGVVRDGSTYRGEGYVVWDYYAYEQPVHAPASGRVTTVTDGETDQSPSAVDWQPFRSAGGNHVVIEVVPGQYLMLAHLRAGSIRVRPGDVVRAGDVLGQVGNSGQSGAPHLHVHVQDHPEPNRGEAIPVPFCAYDVVEWGGSWDAATHVSRGMPAGRNRRQIIRAPSSALQPGS